MRESYEGQTRSNGSTRKRALLWQLAFLLLGGGVLGTALFSQNFVAWVFFYLQPAHWIPWYSVILWLLAIGFCGVFRYRWGRRGIEAAILATIFFCSDNFASVRRPFSVWGMSLWHVSYESLYIPYLYAPWVDFRLTGRLSLRLLMVILIGLGALTLLLILKWQIQSHKKKEKQ